MPNRLIDRDTRVRKKPMRVLVLGMCRTGTTSLSTALRKLGYTPHQMRAVLANPKELALWQEAVNTTLLSPADRPTSQKQMQAYAKPEFDKLLSEYDVVMDIPGCVFAKQLVEAYPDARVLLTTRHYASWEKSMQESIWCLCTWRVFVVARYFNITAMASLMRLVHSLFRVHNGNNYGGPKAKEAYEKHYNDVRRMVPRERLLEVDPEALTWEPLCEFLGREVPEEKFPRLQDEKAMRQNLENAWGNMVQHCVLMLVAPAGAIFLGFMFYNWVDVLREVRDEYILFPIGRYLKS
jgi:hypothetical protein